MQTGIGPVTVKAPKARSRTGEAITFRSAWVPPYLRKTRTLEAAIPWLYLKGVSSGEMGEALKVLVGPDADGLPAKHGLSFETGLSTGIPRVVYNPFR